MPQIKKIDIWISQPLDVGTQVEVKSIIERYSSVLAISSKLIGTYIIISAASASIKMREDGGKTSRDWTLPSRGPLP